MSATARAGKVPAPIAEVVTAFREYTIEVRGLSVWTAQTRGDVVRRFLVEHAPCGADDLASVSVDQVHDFFRHEGQRLATTSMGPVLDSMRSFLRFLFAAELHEHDLSGCLPAITTQRHPTLPRHVPPEMVQALLGSCDRTSTIGARDYAVLLLLSRLALRANEVARLDVDDVHWRTAELTIHSKTGRLDRLPLPDGRRDGRWPTISRSDGRRRTGRSSVRCDAAVRADEPQRGRVRPPHRLGPGRSAGRRGAPAATHDRDRAAAGRRVPR